MLVDRLVKHYLRKTFSSLGNSVSKKKIFDVLSFFLQAYINPLSVNPTKWSNKLKQFVGNLPTACLSVFDHFAKLSLKGYLHYKTITSQNVPSKAQIKNLLFRRKIMFRSQDIQVFVLLTIP